MAQAGLTIDDIDLVEINARRSAAQAAPSAFGSFGIWVGEAQRLHGGAIAPGHLPGMTGARIMTTLLNGLDDAGARYGVRESMCEAGGAGHGYGIVERLTRIPDPSPNGSDLFQI